MLIHIIILVYIQNVGCDVNFNYIQRIDEQKQNVERTFKSTLDIVPNGLLLVDLKSKEIMFANKEMESLVNNFNGGKPMTFKEKICCFLMQRQVTEAMNKD